MSTPWSICRGRKHGQPEKERGRPATEEATTECSGSRGREVRGWRAEVEQRHGRGQKGERQGRAHLSARDGSAGRLQGPEPRGGDIALTIFLGVERSSHPINFAQLDD
jgi:hypothetical protein